MEQKKLSDKAILATILKYFQTNIAQFSKKIGVDRQRLYDLNVGKTQSFTREVLAAIVKACPEISPFFIVTGEGSMTDDATPVHAEKISGDEYLMRENSRLWSRYDDAMQTIGALRAQLEAMRGKNAAPSPLDLTKMESMSR